MNVQLYAYKNNTRYQLDLYEEDPIKITLSAESITEPGVIDSSFTRQFRIPATSNNSQFFQYWYTAGVVDFDVTQKVLAEIHVDGLLYKTGQLRLQAAYTNEFADHIDFEVVFFGETKDFASQVGDRYMNQLPLLDSAHVLNLANLEASWLPLTNPSCLLGGKVRYIIGERGYVYNNDGTQVAVPGQVQPSEVALEISSSHTNSFQKNNHPLDLKQFVPIVQVKYLIDKIFEGTDYSYSTDSIFSTTSAYWSWFQNLYTDGIANNLQYTPSNDARFNANVSQAQPLTDSVWERIEYNQVDYNNANAFQTSTDEFTAPASGSYSFESNDTLFASWDPLAPYPMAYIRLMRYNAITGVTSMLAADSNQIIGGGDTNLTVNWSGTLNTGDKIWMEARVEITDGYDYVLSGNFECISSPVQVAVNDLMKTDLKQIDFFKSILTKFRLVMVPSLENDKQFIIKPWNDYIASGQNFDWTYKLDYSKDVKMEPLFYDQSATINFTDQEDEDYVNKYHQDTYKYVFGRKIFTSNNELLKDEREVTTSFAPTPDRGIEGAGNGTNFIIPIFCEQQNELADHNHPQVTPIVPKPRLMFWNGLRTIALTETWHYSDGVTTKASDQAPLWNGTTDRYPAASDVTEIPTTGTTINLNWAVEYPYYQNGGGPIGWNGKSVYDLFWKDWVNNMYSPEARKLTAYFNLDSEDLRTLTFDDVIWIKDSYWRLQKVYDAPLGEIATVKAELIKILTYVPQVGGSIGGGFDPAEYEEIFVENIPTE